MFDSQEQRKRTEVIIMTLAKLCVILELSTDGCPLCRKTLTHDAECPIFLAWSLLDDDQQHEARTGQSAPWRSAWVATTHLPIQ
jgi:hypothetical protein